MFSRGKEWFSAIKRLQPAEYQPNDAQRQHLGGFRCDRTDRGLCQMLSEPEE